MYDGYFGGSVISRLGSAGLAAVEALQSNKSIDVKSGVFQLMIFHEDIGQLGGISTHYHGQYVLMSAATGRITAARLQELGFALTTRSNGSQYWYCPDICSVKQQSMGCWRLFSMLLPRCP